ncbi:hypothetical protein SERLA73DRAFT_147300 [Serpula lacrymans var. lacrymans S7.3]|uniref:Uncharacterized protein n=2 Tax=Serpula lacrymans var. lacrymans TaxID=341189 RepID=F8QH36_SERL3|nr:uncharacterized protein SERLADRAFT_389075 [Serpula lacrymans var. lacrymans S7.9]EGN92364.1 hypothetical protein SERLA73DRAFT_147300 [Serpula lacrymans var. lacrymans S7.3]EGO24225.1 hypothetical protein SERLADRAFT_389075 [Serpula lacrymans var. lacrymans S7.9]
MARSGSVINLAPQASAARYRSFHLLWIRSYAPRRRSKGKNVSNHIQLITPFGNLAVVLPSRVDGGHKQGSTLFQGWVWVWLSRGIAN